MPSTKDSTSPVIIIAILLVGAVSGYFYYSQVLQDSIPRIPPSPIANQDTLSKFKNITLDFSIFDDKQFKTLHVLGESPVIPGSTGRADIFAPF